MNTIIEKIEALEKSLSRAVAGRITALEEITRRQAEAQRTIEAFAVNPAAEQLAKVYAAHAALATGRELLARFGNLKAWQDRLESAWITSHRAELVALLESLISERSAGREAYLETTAIEAGRLTTELMRADASNAPDDTLTRLNASLSAVEDDRQDRENRLEAATDAIRSFSRAREDAAAYQPLYRMYQNSRDAAANVSFATAPAHE